MRSSRFGFVAWLLFAFVSLLPVQGSSDFSSLAADIKAANSSGSGVITLRSDITLQRELPPIRSTVSIDGAGHSISGDAQFRIFDINGGSLTITDITLSDGRADHGGAIRLLNGAQLSIEGSVLRDNQAVKSGGAIFSSGGAVHIRDSRFELNCAEMATHEVSASYDPPDTQRIIDRDGCPQLIHRWTNANQIVFNNDGRGGAIRLVNGARLTLESTSFKSNKGTLGGAVASSSDGDSLTARGSSFEGNYAHGEGGAVYIGAGRAEISGSSFTENRGERGGGALYGFAGTITVANSTFYNNRWSGKGNAISNSRADLTLTHLTIVINHLPITQGNAIDKRGGIVRLRNSIIADGGPDDHCRGRLDQALGNLDEDGSCTRFTSADHKPGGDPKLGLLTGSPAWLPLRDYSAAVDAANPDYCLETDQIGRHRPHGGGCDIGAIESRSALPARPAIMPPPPCPLALQIIAANTDKPAGGCPAGSGHDIIKLSEDIRLREALPPITSAMTIEGNGHTISGARKYRIFDVDRGHLTINNLTMSEGVENDSNGGAIRLMNGARATVLDSRFVKNRAIQGGAIYAESHPSRLIIRNSRFERNRAGRFGGAILTGGAVTILNSSFVGNRSYREGGAISIGWQDKLYIGNSTFIRNRSNAEGGALSGGEEAQITLEHVTMLDNIALGGAGHAISLPAPTRNIRPSAIYLRNSLLADTAGKEGALCQGRLAQSIGNFIADGTCSPRLSGDPLLDETSDDAVFVQPLADSPLLQAANHQFCSQTDQLGNPRARVGRCDIGAIESESLSRDISDCRVRTRTGLNFRATPGGQRIGIVPAQATVPASARTPGWFQVEYDGFSGWISADYVTTEGNCD